MSLLDLLLGRKEVCGDGSVEGLAADADSTYDSFPKPVKQAIQAKLKFNVVELSQPVSESGGQPQPSETIRDVGRHGHKRGSNTHFYY